MWSWPGPLGVNLAQGLRGGMMGDDVWSALGFSPNYGRELLPPTFFVLQSLPPSQAVRELCTLLALCAHAL